MRKSFCATAALLLLTTQLSGSTLDVTTVARHTGMFGLDIVYTDGGTHPHLVKLFLPDGPFRQLAVRTYLNIGAMACASEPCGVDVMEVRSDTAVIARVSLSAGTAGHLLIVQAFLNNGTITEGAFPIDASDWIRFQINAITATAPGALDGRIDIWVNGGLGVMIPGLDNDQNLISNFRLGVIGGDQLFGFAAFDNVVARNDGAFIADLADFMLTVAKTGTGNGIVTSSPGGIDCGASCSAVFAADSSVTLSPSPDLGSVFIGWGGDCASAVVTMLADRDCTAQFDIQPPYLFLDGFEGGNLDEWEQVVN